MDTVMQRIYTGAIPYYALWSEMQDSMGIRVFYLMGSILCYDLPDTGSERFPWSLLRVVEDMITTQRVFAWAPTLLAQIYKELFLFRETRRASLSVTIMLQAWSYEHIAVIHPPGLPFVRSRGTSPYPSGILRWDASYAARHGDGIVRD